MATHVTFKWAQAFLPDDLHIAWVDVRLLESDGRETVEIDGEEVTYWVNPGWITFLNAQGNPRAVATTLFNSLVTYAQNQHGKTISYDFVDQTTARLHIASLECVSLRPVRRLCNRLLERVSNRIAMLDPDGEIE